MLHKNLSILFISLLVNSISYAQVKKKILTENEKIEQLILAIQNLKSAQFNRNGTLYDAETASKHLKMKWNKAGNSIKTAEDFIDKIASKSSMTGTEYKIVYDNGKEITTKKFLYDKLKNL